MEDREEKIYLKPNDEDAAPIRIGDISNIEDAKMIESEKQNSRNKKIFYWTIAGLIILAVMLAIILPLTLKSKPSDPVPGPPFVQEAIFNGTVCINQTQALLLQARLTRDQKKRFNTRLLYKASQHGWNATIFHDKCDRINSTVTLFLLKNNVTVAGYASKYWLGNSIVTFVTDYEAFLMNLRDNTGYSSGGGYYGGICRYETYGPYFGFGEVAVQNDLKGLSSFTSISISGGFRETGYGIRYLYPERINELTGDDAGYYGLSNSVVTEIETWQVQYE